MRQNDKQVILPPQPNPQVGLGAATANATAPLLLGEYMRHAVSSPSSSSPSTASLPTQHGSSLAILERDRTNHILLYNGCFNPPHRGHLAHLVHAFRYAGAGLHVVGAAILVADDLYLKWKLAGRHGAQRLGLEQRMRLWTEELARTEVRRRGDDGDAIIGEWCWVFSETLWPLYVDRLEHSFDRDGVDVEFVRLAGGDKVTVEWVEHGVWGCDSMITTDVSRPVDFYSNNAGEFSLPRPLRGHSGWETVVGNRQGNPTREGRDNTVDRNNTVPSSSISSPQQGRIILTTSQYSRDVWTCSHQGNGCTIYFIPSSHVERIDPDLSSTKIREIMADSDNLDVNQLEEKLRGMALSPGLLAQYIKETKIVKGVQVTGKVRNRG
ncbi:uncharacterized protein F4812DRAFT_444050 [Daldinia caldariorum]|uniref:uncharacterized protein n=1 Tax=Daldinia caldariorum TaxID=326644 RepID=UPI002008B369|nr:uncharacterized protein F4812DRAFT_444050 [Daldinia caldariorum]KAI1464279.1 hypothetical protein F4812DRAFT_444050 [Daldinia caldariorum]